MADLSGNLPKCQMRRRLLRWSAIALLCFSPPLSPNARAQAAHGTEPSLEAVPPDVTARTLPAARPIEVDVRLKAGDTQLSNVAISMFSNDGIEARLAKDSPAQLRQLPPKAEHVWRLEVSRGDGNVLAESFLQMRVSFDMLKADTAAPGTATPIRQFLYTTFKVKPVAAATGLVTAAIKGVPESLAHERPGQIFILVTNNYSRPITVRDVKLLGPSFVQLSNPNVKADPNPAPESIWKLLAWILPGQTRAGVGPPSAARGHPKIPLSIPPGQTQAIDYTIKAGSDVVPGKYALIASVDVTTDDQPPETIVSLPQDVTVVVLGESDVLKFLGLPSLLFLPGVLMLIAWQFLWSMGKSKGAKEEYEPKWNTSQFWVIAITLSLITAVVYPLITGLLFGSGNTRNFVAAYGLVDFGIILGFSLIASGLVFGLVTNISLAVRSFRAHRLAESTPAAGDGPLQILNKLAKQNKDNRFEQFSSAANSKEHLLLLEPWSTADELWLVPPAEFDVNRNDYEAIDEADRLLHDPPPTAADLLTRIRQGMAKNWWGEPRWRQDGDVRQPTKVPRTAWTLRRGSDQAPEFAHLLQGS